MKHYEVEIGTYVCSQFSPAIYQVTKKEKLFGWNSGDRYWMVTLQNIESKVLYEHVNSFPFAKLTPEEVTWRIMQESAE